MSRPPLYWLGSLATGLAAGVLAHLIVDAVLAGALALCTAVGAFLVLRIRDEYPDRVTGDTWADRRWTGFSVAVITAVAFFGPMLIPVSGDYRFGLQLLVLLSGTVGYLAGSLAEMERDANREPDRDATATPVDD